MDVSALKRTVLLNILSIIIYVTANVKNKIANLDTFSTQIHVDVYASLDLARQDIFSINIVVIANVKLSNAL